MRVTQQVVVFDAADLGTESAFWAGLFEGTIETHEHYHAVNVDGEMRVAVQFAPNHVPPQWPDGAPQQVHLDLVVDDVAAAEAEALKLGARLLLAATGLDAESGYRVYADPAGHPFCLCWGNAFSPTCSLPADDQVSGALGDRDHPAGPPAVAPSR